ncbi:MAG: CRISPR-associated endonuclease Cas1 [Thermoanaerobaculum sp.]|nr:CRISPR-associated endonuclease Cas1 [Thermoanaerobaculum sp.]
MIFALVESGFSVHLRGELLELRRGGKLARTLKLNEIEQLLLLGQVEVSHAALMALLGRNIDVVFLTKAGSFRGRLVSRASRHVELRVSQYRRLADPNFSLAIARSIVAAKIKNQRHLLVRAQTSLADETVADVSAKLRFLAQEAQSATSREELLGIEGSASNLYFGCFGRLIRNPLFSFTKRTRRPPKDPVNACLSFGYVLLTTLVEGDVASAGLDPMLGAFHQPEYGRPSLALDLVEEFRAPLVDSLTLRLINRRQLVPGDFGTPSEALGEDQLVVDEDTSGAVYLAERGRKIFLKEFFSRLREELFDPQQGNQTDWRGLIRSQVYRLARAIKEEQQYQPFVHH